MKNIILLLAFQLLLVQDISCDNDLLSKFHQNGYKIKDERIQLMRYNKSAFNSFEITAFKYNRTTTAHNASFTFEFNLLDKIEALVQGYKFLSNEYRYFPLRFQANLKKIVDANIMGLGSIKNCGYVGSFYFYKNITYTICNYVVDGTCLPPLIPNGKYRIDVTFLYNNVEISLLNMFGEVYIPFEYPKEKTG